MSCRRLAVVAFTVLFVPVLVSRADAQQGEVLERQLDASGKGYSVLRVWGTTHEMGYAQGFLYAKEIAAAVEQFKASRSGLYALVKAGVLAAVWDADDADEEIAGIVAGVKAALPDATLDEGDLKVANTYGDWGYAYACRSHSVWGPDVAPPYKTLSTRRLDFGSPVDAVDHHVLVARKPDKGVRWVNLQWPGLALSVTGVNEYGTLASLHDYRSKAETGKHLPRSALVRIALRVVDGLPLEQHLDAVYNKLQPYTITTGTFLNVYVPEGHGGVLTCDSAGKCHKKRVPQADFFDGKVLLTTNAETDGHSPPSDDSFMAPYYEKGGQKTLADHHALMGSGGLHLLSVGYKARGDMTLWFRGRGTATVKYEWSQLFSDSGAPPPPTSQPVVDGGTPTSQPVVDSGVNPPPPATGGDDDGGGCSVGTLEPLPLLIGLPLLGVLLGLWAFGRRRG